MTSDEAEEFHQLVTLALSYPERVELVAGPYCGAVLFPHVQKLTTVLHEDDELWPDLRDVGPTVPVGFHPLSESSIVFLGAFGPSVYSLRDDGSWFFDWDRSAPVPIGG